MKRFSQRSAFSTLAELNVTPLLDLAFVLLIIFVISTPLIDRKADLVLPSSRASEGAIDPSNVQTVTIDRNLQLALNGDPLQAEVLAPELAALAQEKGEIGVIIRAHKELPVQQLVDVMDVIRKAKIAKVGVVTQTGP
jgi:biopolymer transport protein ExbD